MVNRPAASLTDFFFNDAATSEIYTLSLHDALPICVGLGAVTLGVIGAVRKAAKLPPAEAMRELRGLADRADRKSTRLNSSHMSISYAVFCLKKKKIPTTSYTR